jgi:hypothetical protein
MVTEFASSSICSSTLLSLVADYALSSQNMSELRGWRRPRPPAAGSAGPETPGCRRDSAQSRTS